MGHDCHLKKYLNCLRAERPEGPPARTSPQMYQQNSLITKG
ncbi:hypothetical protein MICA_2430 [Micavibrio aeruginosavorus ARL-13]|uniref:Uncharacterized protein n=2 Tax=Micavibrio aeruginosavorus TaxID=349221 RepID=G2KNT7_MICAA|nr:hypothetical protein MICA_2430 [Micavibrio aeruginosavorus ARL-13]AGH99163.1 hypothetical protein A11S_2368 [Micavibrio aeruginosavorus EPB]